MRDETLGAVSGFLAGILNALAVGPLDVVKVSPKFRECRGENVEKNKDRCFAAEGSCHPQDSLIVSTGLNVSFIVLFRTASLKAFDFG